MFNRIKSLQGSEGVVTTSIGYAGSGYIYDIPRLYKQSIECLSHKLYLGSSILVFYEDVVTKSIQDYNVSVNEKELRGIILRYDYVSTSQVILNTLEKLKEQKCINVNVVKNVCIDLKNILLRALNENGYDFEFLFGTNMSYVSDIPLFETIDDYMKWITDIYYLVLIGLSDMKGIRHNTLVFKATEFIKKNYSMDLNVEVLSNYVQKSPDYFSRVFKRELGISYSEYLNRVRINEAKRLMKTTNLLAYEISDRVGFQDYKYFVQVFKKLEGHSPSKFRKGKSE